MQGQIGGENAALMTLIMVWPVYSCYIHYSQILAIRTSKLIQSISQLWLARLIYRKIVDFFLIDQNDH